MLVRVESLMVYIRHKIIVLTSWVLEDIFLLCLCAINAGVLLVQCVIIEKE